MSTDKVLPYGEDYYAKVAAHEKQLATALKALVRIAEHFEGCDISDDASDRRVLKIAIDALGWTYHLDDAGQIKLDRVVER